jgi:hypothetical protein
LPEPVRHARAPVPSTVVQDERISRITRLESGSDSQRVIRKTTVSSPACRRGTIDMPPRTRRSMIVGDNGTIPTVSRASGDKSRTALWEAWPAVTVRHTARTIATLSCDVTCDDARTGALCPPAANHAPPTDIVAQIASILIVSLCAAQRLSSPASTLSPLRLGRIRKVLVCCTVRYAAPDWR